MKAEKPAEGILKRNEWGDTKAYEVVCSCGDGDHSHNVWVEAEDTGINVNVYVNVKSPVWSMNRWKQVWTLMVNGYLQHETTITMTKQQALNYAETLKSAIKDVEGFEKSRQWKKDTVNRIAQKLAEEGDCV